MSRPSLSVDVNADMGESFGVYRYGADEALLPLVTSVNVAAGFHASDPVTLKTTISRAIANDVRLGVMSGTPTAWASDAGASPSPPRTLTPTPSTSWARSRHSVTP